MNLNINDLCKDPLFQLNLAIWLTQPQPLERFYVYPVFYESKLNIYSIGPLLALPPDIRIAVKDKINCQDSVRPDIILEMQGKRLFCILECKSSSFGPESSNTNQARNLLLISGPIFPEVLAIGNRGEYECTLCYFIGANSVELMEKTLKILEDEIRDKTNLATGNFGCFGIKPSKSAIVLEYSERVKTLFNLKFYPEREIIRFEQDTDPRPIYFIPYDPNLEQTEEEQRLCRRILFERILSYIISNIGSSDIPMSVTFTTEELLSSATFGFYEIWEDNEAKKHVRRLVKGFLNQVTNSVSEPLKESITYESLKGWTFNLKNIETYIELLKQLQKFKPESLDLSKQIQPDLFDTLEPENVS